MTTDFGVASAEQTAASPTSASACAVHRDAIELGLSRGRNAMAIWQDMATPARDAPTRGEVRAHLMLLGELADRRRVRQELDKALEKIRVAGPVAKRPTPGRPRGARPVLEYLSNTRPRRRNGAVQRGKNNEFIAVTDADHHEGWATKVTMVVPYR